MPGIQGASATARISVQEGGASGVLGCVLQGTVHSGPLIWTPPMQGASPSSSSALIGLQWRSVGPNVDSQRRCLEGHALFEDTGTSFSIYAHSSIMGMDAQPKGSRSRHFNR